MHMLKVLVTMLTPLLVVASPVAAAVGEELVARAVSELCGDLFPILPEAHF
jgi:hypothetical protein